MIHIETPPPGQTLEVGQQIRAGKNSSGFPLFDIEMSLISWLVDFKFQLDSRAFDPTDLARLI